jgi:hypothetical protein
MPVTIWDFENNVPVEYFPLFKPAQYLSNFDSAEYHAKMIPSPHTKKSLNQIHQMKFKQSNH